jgi:hypothetical protein
MRSGGIRWGFVALVVILVGDLAIWRQNSERHADVAAGPAPSIDLGVSISPGAFQSVHMLASEVTKQQGLAKGRFLVANKRGEEADIEVSGISCGCFEVSIDGRRVHASDHAVMPAKTERAVDIVVPLHDKLERPCANELAVEIRVNDSRTVLIAQPFAFEP